MERWSDIEIEMLSSLYPKYGPDFCSKLLPTRTKRSIINKANKLKIGLLYRNQHFKKSHEEYKKELESTDYEVLESYISSSKKIRHKHKKCGYEWSVSPNNLQKLVGCPKCSETGKNYLYLLEIAELNLYKIGITSNIEKRIAGLSNLYSIHCLSYWYFENFEDTYIVEQALLRKLPLYNTHKLSNGNTETFKWYSSQDTLLSWLETELNQLTQKDPPVRYAGL